MSERYLERGEVAGSSREQCYARTRESRDLITNKRLTERQIPTILEKVMNAITTVLSNSFDEKSVEKFHETLNIGYSSSKF